MINNGYMQKIIESDDRGVPMREFEYFLFENFDADEESNNRNNPRNFLGKRTDIVLSEVAQLAVNTCSYNESCEKYSTQLIRKLIDGGVLRPSGIALAFDCPIFLREDAAVLHTVIASKAAVLVDLLQSGMAEIRDCCSKIENGFPVELNLYHILCGMIFDGYFFDYLSGMGAVATSRQHPSGLDYLSVIYEKCEELQTLSDGLLCSYNRFVNAKCSLQSFGDAQGNRFDFYRFFRLMEQGSLPDKFKDAEALVLDFGGANKDSLLDEVVALMQTGRCDPVAMDLLELFGYTQDGAICVPVYTPEHKKYIAEIESIVEKCLGNAMAETLIELTGSIDITAVKHGVNHKEIANELYHIVFGSINEELVARGVVATPPNIPGEGRCFMCVEMYV